MPVRPTHRRTLLVAAAAMLSCTVVVEVALADPIASIDGAAGASVVAVRGPSTQVEQPAPPPDHNGCLKGTGTKVSAAVDPAQRWYIDIQDTTWRYWKISFYPRPGVRGAVAVVGDSLTVASTEETMRDLIDAGYGPICIDAQVARRVSVYTSALPSGVQEIARIKSSDAVWRLSTVRWVIALGTNDTRADISNYSATIQKGRDAVGSVTVPIYWIDVRTRLGAPYTTYENAWNDRLPGPNIVVIGWAAAVAASPTTYINNTDLIHLTPAGEVLRGQITRAALVAT
jgi:hypothetical protein